MSTCARHGPRQLSSLHLQRVRVFTSALPLRFNSGLLFGIFAMLGSVVLLVKTLQQTLAQMTTNNPRMGGQQTLQVVVGGHGVGSFRRGFTSR